MSDHLYSFSVFDSFRDPREEINLKDEVRRWWRSLQATTLEKIKEDRTLLKENIQPSSLSSFEPYK